jgi:hypothetical protein
MRVLEKTTVYGKLTMHGKMCTTDFLTSWTVIGLSMKGSMPGYREYDHELSIGPSVSCLQTREEDECETARTMRGK